MARALWKRWVASLLATSVACFATVGAAQAGLVKVWTDDPGININPITIPLIMPGMSWRHNFAATGNKSAIFGTVLAWLDASGLVGGLDLTEFYYECRDPAQFANASVDLACEYSMPPGFPMGRHGNYGTAMTPRPGAQVTWSKASTHNATTLRRLGEQYEYPPEEHDFWEFTDWCHTPLAGEYYTINTTYGYTLVKDSSIYQPTSGRDEFIPEPATLSMFVLAGLLVRRRRTA